MTARGDVQVGDARYWRTDDGFTVAVRVRNESDRTLLVGCGVRQIQYDPSTRELTVWFSDHGRDAGLDRGPCRVDTVPRTASVEAGEEIEVRGRVPARLHRIGGTGDDGIEVEVRDLEDVADVVVHVAAAEAPFYFNPKGGSAVEQLKEWGQDFEVGARRLRSQRREGKEEGGETAG